MPRRLALSIGTAVVLAGGLVLAGGSFLSPAAAKVNQADGRGLVEAQLEVFVEDAEWTPEEGQAWEIGSLGGRAVTWGELMENRNVSIEGGAGGTGVSVERIAVLNGIPLVHITGAVVSNAKEEMVKNRLGKLTPEQVVSEQLTFSREEALGGGTIETPLFEPEGEYAAMSAIAFVSPSNNPQPAHLESGEAGIMRITLKISGGLLYLAPLAYSPAEPSADVPVAFSAPEVTNRQTVGANDTYKYFWSFGDGTTSTEAAPKHTYQRNGTSSYAVYAEVTTYSPGGEEIAAGSALGTVVLNSKSVQPPPPTTVPTSEPPPPPEEEEELHEPSRGHTDPAKKPKHHVHHRTEPPPQPGETLGTGQGGTGGTGNGTEVDSPDPATSVPSEPTQPSPVPVHQTPPPIAHEIKRLRGLIGVILSGAHPLSGSALAQVSAPPTTSPLKVRQTPPPSVSPLGALGLTLAITAILAVMLFGAFGELRAMRFVR